MLRTVVHISSSIVNSYNLSDVFKNRNIIIIIIVKELNKRKAIHFFVKRKEKKHLTLSDSVEVVVEANSDFDGRHKAESK